MKKLVKRSISMLLCLAMVIGFIPATMLSASAISVGDRVPVATTGGTRIDNNTIDTKDYISLPIEVYDFKADGMLFEYTEVQLGSTYGNTYTTAPSGSVDVDLGWNFLQNGVNAISGSDGLKAGGQPSTLNLTFTNTYPTDSSGIRYLHTQKNQNTYAYFDERVFALGNLGGVSKEDARYMVIKYRSSNTNGFEICFRDQNLSTGLKSYYTHTFTANGAWQTAVIDISKNTFHSSTSSSLKGTWSTMETSHISKIGYVGLLLKNTSSGNADRDRCIYSGGSFDIAYVAFFSNEADAKAFNQEASAITGKTYYVTRNNQGLGLVGGSKKYTTTSVNYFDRISATFGDTSKTSSANTYPHGQNSWFNSNSYTPKEKYNDLDTSIWQLRPGQITTGYSLEDCLGYNLMVDYSRTSVTAGLLNPVLGADGNPRYKEETVYYVANHLKTSLEVPMMYNDSYYNYHYVMGEEFNYDGVDGTEQLADLIRKRVATSGNDIGDYETTYSKRANLIGSYAKCAEYITTYMDAAYYLLNNIFVAGSYNTVDNTYDHLLLSKAQVNGVDCYVFDAGFASSNTASTAAITYNKAAGTIQNSSAAYKPYSYYDTEGYYTTTFPFLPLTETNNQDGMTKTPYFKDDAVSNGAGVFNTYQNRNYNYILRSHGEFTYDAVKDLFFQFEGDDDVYLFINGQLVMDMGGAHPVALQSFKLNDYVTEAKKRVAAGSTDARDKALALEEGKNYSFDFFYMERKGYGANMRIVTNIEVVDTDMGVEKDAYQSGYKLPDNTAIDINEPVEFSFTLTNEGNASSTDDSYLHSVVFSDPRIGVTISHDKGLQLGANSRAVNAQGEPLTWKDLKFYFRGKEYSFSSGDFKAETDDDDGKLKAFLAKPADTGLLKGESLTVRGIYVELEATDFTSGPWINTVTVDAMTGNGTALRSTDELRLNNVMQPVYYMWAGHDLTISDDILLADINEAYDAGALSGLLTAKLKSIQSVTLTNTAGVPVTNNNVASDGTMLTVSYKVPGTYLDHVRIAFTDVSGKTGTVILPIHTYVVDVKDEVFVLDYGLQVNLSDGQSLIDEDTLKVAGHATTTRLDAIYNSSPNYVVGASGNHLGFATSGQEGTYTISNAAGLAIAVKNSSLAAGTTLIVQEPSKIGNEKAFTFQKYASVDSVDYYTIKSSATNKYMSIGQNGLTLEAYTGNDNQLWYIDSGKIINKASALGLISGANSGDAVSYGKNATTWTLTPVEGNSGEFNFYTDAQVLHYKPADFMEDAETAYLTVRVYEPDFTPSNSGVTDINHEVEMFKAVTVIPANVVYYEDDFPAINYFNDEGEAFQNKITTDGSSGNLYQSNDQDENYGHDKVYEEGGVPVSGKSVTTITIDSVEQDKRVAEFTFAGTGFELISRTTATDSASIVVKVLNAAGETVKSIPVITEFDNDANNAGNPHTEAIYQVPVIKVDGLDFGSYTVQILGMASLAKDENGKIVIENGKVKYKTTYLYIDGIRIYNPLGGGNVADLKNQYTEGEQNITFSEIRDMVLNTQLGVVECFTDSWTVGTGLNTYTENRVNAGYDGDGGWAKKYEGNVVTDINDYLAMGPNNEVYLNGISSNQAIVLYVKQTDAQKQGTLQIGMHLINEKTFFGLDGDATHGVIKMGVLNENGQPAWQSFHTDLSSGTELYYSIDYTKCPIDSNGYYQVVLSVEDGMVSFTNLKHSGLDFKTMSGNAPEIYFENGKLILPSASSEQTISTANYVDFPLLADQLRSTEVVQPEPPAPPATEPEATEPEATEPEATEPKPTEPEATKCTHSYDDNVDGTCNVCGVKREDVEKRQVVHMFRMYNPNTGEHFYTGSEIEKNDLIEAGWKYEGVAFTFPANTGAPVYRLFHEPTGEHLYTMDKAEKEKLEAEGWNYEGVAFNSAYNTEAVQHRLHNPNATVGAYHFTFSEEEKQNLINAGWEYQGIGWYSCWK